MKLFRLSNCLKLCTKQKCLYKTFCFIIIECEIFFRYFYIIIQLFYFSGQPRSSLETKKNSITDDYTISQTVLGLGINGKGGLILEVILISVISFSKGGLISESVSFWLKSSKKRCQITTLSTLLLRFVNWHLF